MAFKVSDDFKGVLSFGKEKFFAGAKIPEGVAKKLDIDSLVADGVLVDGKSSESGNKTLADMTKAELLQVAEEMELEISSGANKEEILLAIKEAQAG